MANRSVRRNLCINQLAFFIVHQYNYIMEQKPIGIVLKLLAAVAFLGGIVGGGYTAVSSITGGNDDLQTFAIGLVIVICAVFVIACLVPWIAHIDGHADWEASEGKTTIATSIKTGLMTTFFVSILIFVFIGISFWAARGIWQLGVAAIAALLIMIVIAIEASIRFQTRHSRNILKNKSAEERIGRITSVRGKFPILLFGKDCYLIKVCVVETDGITSQAFMRASDKLAKRLYVGSEVKIKTGANGKYCAIIDVAFAEDN